MREKEIQMKKQPKELKERLESLRVVVYGLSMPADRALDLLTDEEIVEALEIATENRE